MRHIFYLFLYICISLCCIRIADAQQPSYHFTWPGPDVDSINFGVIDNNITLINNKIWIYNPTDDTLWYYGGTAMFGDIFLIPYDGSFSLTIAPHDSGRLFTNLSTNGAQIDGDNHFTGLEIFEIGSITDTSKHWEVTVHNISSVYYPPDLKEQGISIFQNQEVIQWLMRYDDQTQTIAPISTMEYYNPFDSDVTIQTLFVPKGSHFSISGLSNSNFPVTLHKNDRLTVQFSYSSIPDSAGYIYRDLSDTTLFDTIYNDLIVIITDTTFQVGMAKYNGSAPKLNPKSLVKNSLEAQNQDDIIVGENPIINSTTISLSNALNGQFRIYDLLGNIVAEFNGTSMQWNGISGLGYPLANGIYTIDAEGISKLGKPFQSTKKIILMK